MKGYTNYRIGSEIMKKILNSRLFAFIMGAIICGTTGVIASNLMASNIAYTPKDNTWGVNNVEAAIDSLKLSKTSDNYSTEEKVVGTWIDGKPLYQKVVNFSSSGSFSRGWNNNFAYLGADIDTVVSLQLNAKKQNFDMLYYSVSDSGYLSVYQETADTYGKPTFAIMVYTKTTDAATN